jgi:hypothetical protein
MRVYCCSKLACHLLVHMFPDFITSALLCGGGKTRE